MKQIKGLSHEKTAQRSYSPTAADTFLVENDHITLGSSLHSKFADIYAARARVTLMQKVWALCRGLRYASLWLQVGSLLIFVEYDRNRKKEIKKQQQAAAERQEIMARARMEREVSFIAVKSEIRSMPIQHILKRTKSKNFRGLYSP
jgi:hypothetical protein